MKHFLGNNNIINNMSSWHKAHLIQTNKLSHTRTKPYHTRTKPCHKDLINHFVKSITQTNRPNLGHGDRSLNLRHQSNQSCIKLIRKRRSLKIILNKGSDIIRINILKPLVENSKKAIMPKSL